MNSIYVLLKAGGDKVKSIYSFIFFYLPVMAHAKLSDRASGVSEEGSSLMSEFIFWAKLGGLGIFVVALASAISKKKKNQPLDWEVWGLIGGACLAIALQLFGDTTGSLGSDEVDVNGLQRSQSNF